MDRYVSALGGHDAVFTHPSMTARGKYEESDKGPSMDRAAYYKGGKMLYEVVLPNGSRYQEGFDGKVAWQIHPRNGPAISVQLELAGRLG